jgi:DnaK suppressor protein
MPAKKPAARKGKPKKSAARGASAKKPAARKSAASKAKPKRAAVRKAPAKSPKKKPVKAAAKARKPSAKRTPAKKVSRKAAKPAKARTRLVAKTVAKQKVTASRSSVKPTPTTKAKAAAKVKAAPKAKATAKIKAAPSRAEAKAPKRAAATRRKAALPPKAIAVPSRARLVEAVAEDEEGYEFDGRHDLLTGPRNVKPYVQQRGETYMSASQLEHFRTILSSWKRDLMEEVDRTVNHMKDEAANPPDPNDRATLESEFALELRTRDRERKLIRKIDEALKRIDDGSYGFCLETGEPIGVKRLEARPVATLCIEAQERRERRERQYGDRDDWYR